MTFLITIRAIDFTVGLGVAEGEEKISIFSPGIRQMLNRHLIKNFYNFIIGTKERIKNISLCNDLFILANN